MAVDVRRITGHENWAKPRGRKSDPAYPIEEQQARVAALDAEDTAPPVPEEDIMASLEDLKNLLVKDRDVREAFGVGAWSHVGPNLSVGGKHEPVMTILSRMALTSRQAAEHSAANRAALAQAVAQAAGLEAAVKLLAQQAGQDGPVADEVLAAVREGARDAAREALDRIEIELVVDDGPAPDEVSA